MPKVNKEYFEKKENLIVDAAIRVCQNKPLYEVTLRDVIRESGISPGGMYCYFSCIDEIFAAILNRCYRETNLENGVERIFESGENPEIIIETAFKCIGEIIEKASRPYGKLISDLNTIFLNDPGRKQKIKALLTVESDCNKIGDLLLVFIEKHIEAGYFNPVTSKPYILLLVGIAIQGIISSLPFPDETKNSFYDSIGLDQEHRSARGMADALSKMVIDSLKIVVRKSKY